MSLTLVAGSLIFGILGVIGNRPIQLFRYEDVLIKFHGNPFGGG